MENERGGKRACGVSHLFRIQVKPHAVILPYSMTIRIAATSPSLEVFAAYKTAVNVDVAKGFRTHTLEIKVQIRPRDLH